MHQNTRTDSREKIADFLKQLLEMKEQRKETTPGEWKYELSPAVPDYTQLIEIVPVMLEQAEEQGWNDMHDISNGILEDILRGKFSSAPSGIDPAGDTRWNRISAEIIALVLGRDRARHEATQIERKTLETAVRILLENEPGAAMNAVRDDYPEFAELIDRRSCIHAEGEEAHRAVVAIIRSAVADAERQAFLKAAKFAENRDSGAAVKGQWGELYSQGYNDSCRELADEFSKLAEEGR